MFILVKTISLSPILFRILHTHTKVSYEGRYIFLSALKVVEVINPLISYLIRGAPLAGHRVRLLLDSL